MAFAKSLNVCKLRSAETTSIWCHFGWQQLASEKRIRWKMPVCHREDGKNTDNFRHAQDIVMSWIFWEFIGKMEHTNQSASKTIKKYIPVLEGDAIGAACVP